MSKPQESLFLTIPVEIRLIIYSHLIPQTLKHAAPTRPSPATIPTGHENEDPHAHPAPDGKPMLSLRILDPDIPSPLSNNLSTLHRTKFFIRTGRFRARTMNTTYTCTNKPQDLDVSILGVCRQTHAEASEVLYGTYTWDFDTHVEALPAFLGDLTSRSREAVKRISLVKRALAYDRSSDLCEWESATIALSSLPGLRVLYLGIVAGMPGRGWPETTPIWSKGDLEMMVRFLDWKGLEWLRDVAGVRIQEGGRVDVRPVMENCPDVRDSEMLGFWVGVSRSLVEGGFGEWARELIMAD
ncbi:hypothetical protein FKW77_005656 [Venturia effusa]|uniref:Uncharacterized protein n=1 Tax=Venturia effusa TaxID=50376 RepID=A0A517LIU1_9PEZI|nr:hypothetical protein FKW77_005656 [Venturia effusa]